MNTSKRACTALAHRSVFVSLFLFSTLSASAQTFFGSGSNTNSNAVNATNHAFGYGALSANTTGFSNAAFGNLALSSNTIGSNNSAFGLRSLYLNITGGANAAFGTLTLGSNTTGNYNSAFGYAALGSNSYGNYNTAFGNSALYFNTEGIQNAAFGSAALNSNAFGSYNVAFGNNSLLSNTTGTGNTTVGFNALSHSIKANFNIAIGYNAGSKVTASNNIEIGNIGTSNDVKTIRIGTVGTHTSTYIAGISGATSANGVAVYIDANGQLGTITSSRRFKKDIHSMAKVSEKLLQLRPVTFRYKEADATGKHALQYGLIAEEVAKVDPDLVQYDKSGKPFTVRYHLLTPMLLNELQKERTARKVEVASQNAKLKAVLAENATMKTELASLKKAQAEQQKLLAKLAAYVQNGKNTPNPQKVSFIQH